MGAPTVDAARPDGRRAPVRPTPPQRDRPGVLRGALLLLAALAVVAGGLWGLLAPRDSHHAAGSQADLAEVEGGVLRVDGLADKTVGHAMAGMDMPDDVAPGMRRFALNVTLAATGDEPLAYRERDFLVSGRDVKPVVPVRSDFEAGSVTAGSALSGVLTFDVPEDTAVLDLHFQNAEPVGLPKLPQVSPAGHMGPAAEGDAHGDQAHGDQAHGDQAQGDQAQGDQAHGDQAHGDQAHGDGDAHDHADHAH